MGLKMSFDFNKENQESEVKTNTTSSNGGLKMNGFSDSAPSGAYDNSSMKASKLKMNNFSDTSSANPPEENSYSNSEPKENSYSTPFESTKFNNPNSYDYKSDDNILSKGLRILKSKKFIIPVSICAVLIIALCIGMSVRRNSDSYLYGLLDDGNVSKISELYVSNYSKNANKQSDFIDKIDTYAESNFNEYVNDSISYDELMRKYSTIQSVYDRFSINDSEFESNMKSADSIKELKTMYQKGIAYIYDNGKDEGRHLITIVGYDDNVKFSYGNYSTTGGFKIANSWGTSWGNSGYIWVAYDAFYKNSANRPKERNGYGFVSSWWNENSDENVYYTINLDENYAPYQASYIGELSLSSKKLSSTHLTYATKENLEAELSHENDIFNGENYANIYGLPTKFYTGTIALDLSDMSYYMDNSDAYWEICLNGITAGKLKVIDSDSNVILSSTSGTKWVKPHEHIYTEGEMTYNESQWTRNDTCNICNEVNTVNGACYFNMDFENGVNASDWINNGRGVISSSSDDNNTYMQINYVNESGDKPNYFEISNPTNWYYSNTKISGLTEMSFDVKFGGIDGDIYLKQRAEDINKIVLRICCKEVGRLQYGTNGGRRTFFDENEQYINPIDRWLHIRIIANISENNDEAKQTIYVTDRNTGELISTVENKALASDVSYCNMITIGGSSEVDIDNIIVRDVK